eukprot:scaffold313553_cov40-Tisochrysis_lutea.AAC.1
MRGDRRCMAMLCGVAACVEGEGPTAGLVVALSGGRACGGAQRGRVHKLGRAAPDALLSEHAWGRGPFVLHVRVCQTRRAQADEAAGCLCPCTHPKPC